MMQRQKMMIPALALWLLCSVWALAAPEGPKETAEGLSAAVPSLKYDAALMISPVRVMQQLKIKNSLILVDVRHPNRFNRFKIPGSLNMPLSIIKTKQFLKTKPIVLIHRGFGYSELIREIKPLNAKGFHIRILRGGLLAWKHKGGTIVGDPFAQKDLNKISVKAFILEKDYEDWVIVNADETQSDTVKKQMPNILHPKNIKPSLKPEEVINQVLSGRDALRKNKAIPIHSPLTAVIVVSETGRGYEKLEKKIDKTHGHKVFYLKGGLEAYQQYLKNHRLATAPKAERTLSTKQCEPCKKKIDQ